MGIKHFWIWFKKNYRNHIVTINKNRDTTANIEVDMLAIDMNGIFHTCAQKIYKYGNFAPRFKQLLPRKSRKKEKRLFALIAETVNFYRKLVSPKKRLLLCVDGVAGLAKMSQQRQRRFRSAKERSPMSSFDSNSITPGTRFMDHLTNYLDWYIRIQSSFDPEWEKLEVIFSNEKVPGEGEHKIINYLRKFKKTGESCCIHGMDADLIMLGLAAPCKDIFILRDDSFNLSQIHVINLGMVRIELSKRLAFDESSNSKHISDFILMCYAVGNDFLPQIPGIEILEGGIDSLIEVYTEIVTEYGHLAGPFRGKLRLKRKNFALFLKEFAMLEEDLINNKLNRKISVFPDPLIQKNCSYDADGNKVINLENYKKAYYAKKFPPGVSIETICIEYLRGTQWVLNYYTTGIPSWSWCYPWHYSPFLSDVATFVHKANTREFITDTPLLPFQQLISVLPEASANLLPDPIPKLMCEESKIGQFFPKDFEIDLAGKRREWEGIVLLPSVDIKLFINELETVMHLVNRKQIRRNIHGKNFLYKHSTEQIKPFFSYYGTITENFCQRSFVYF